ncbi:hypothetical protein ACFV8T_34745 [Streptomyces sp. NPDC059832]|uniref:hypothetical protein n=1 Tax=Streptomyces sp. NPDC059832 TaxID=3346966 RepID=UPI00364BB96A
MRIFVWRCGLGVLAILMAAFTPHVFRAESTWQAIAWSVVLIGTVTFVATLIRAELLLRRLGPAGGQRHLRDLILMASPGEHGAPDRTRGEHDPAHRVKWSPHVSGPALGQIV